MPAPIPLHELTFRATKAGGPGGQHVNTSSTRVELWWNPVASPSLTERERTLLTSVLGRRLDGEGWLRLVSRPAPGASSRTGTRSTKRFQKLVAEALVPPKPRRKTRPPRSAAENRLKAKKRRSATKAKRRTPLRDD